MDIQTLEIVQTANNLVRDLGTRDPHKIARELGIEIIPMNYKRQRGAYVNFGVQAAGARTFSRTISEF